MTLHQAAIIYNKANKRKKRPVAIVGHQGVIYRVSTFDGITAIDYLFGISRPNKGGMGI